MTIHTVTQSVGVTALTKLMRAKNPHLAVRAMCRQLLRDCGIDRPPIPLKRLLAHLGVSVEVTEEKLHADAILDTRDSKYVLSIERGALEKRWERARFTIAHECGHVLFYKYLKDAKLIASLDATQAAHNELERLCDVAASELLMPRHALREAARGYGVTPFGLTRLRDTFGVSRSALMNNLADVLPGTTILVWRHHARHALEGEAFRIAIAQQYHPHIAQPWLPKGCTSRHVSPRLIDTAANERRHIFEDDIEVSLGKRRWRGQGLATFFPVEETIKQADFEKDKERRSGPLKTIFLFWGNKRFVSPSHYLGSTGVN